MLEQERWLSLPWSERLRRGHEREVREAVCPECGRNIHEAGRNIYHATYCSDACKMRAYRRRRVTSEVRLINQP
ncbi:MAG: hypothetical protein JO168_02350 [Solirubrobacterales bacterium]|nr:hypothetical protein [Solirubrobacterales bacterium]